MSSQEHADTEAELAVSRIKQRLFGCTEPPLQVGRFELRECLGSGGMGVVYEAFDPSLSRRVALKLLRTDVAADREIEHRRLHREAQALARLSHPNVAAVYEVGRQGDATFVVMELVDGPTLRQWLTERPRDPAETIAMFVQAGRGLAAAHRSGLVHRDFKPDNVLVGADGRARVVDFGLARPGRVELEPPRMPTASREEADSIDDVTQRGVVVGTPAYMAPEQIRGEALDARVDQFAFCVALFECLGGSRPFAAGSAKELLREIEHARADWSVLASGVPASVRRVLARGLQPAPEDRFVDMDALLATLAPPRRDWRRWVLAGAVLGLPAGMAIWATVSPTGPCDGLGRELSGTWDLERQTRLAAAFTDADPKHGAEQWERLRTTVDDYASGWTRAYESACTAAHVEREVALPDYDRRVECFDHRRRELYALTERLLHADAATLRSATKAALSLGSVDACADANPRRLEAARPVDPELRAALDTVEAELAEVAADRALGRYAEAIARAEQLVPRAEATGYLPVHAAALVEYGVLQGHRGDTAGAVSTLQDAVLVAFKDDRHASVFEAANNLVYIEGYVRRDTDEALRWARRAEAALQALGAPDRLRAAYHEKVGSVLHVAGRRDEAREHYDRALTAARAALGPEHPTVGGVLNNLGVLAREAGEYDRARALTTQALAIRRTALGEHPDTALALANLATVELVAGNSNAAIAAYEDALAIYADTTGIGHAVPATILTNLAVALDEAGRHDDALSRHRQALEALETATGRRSPQYAQALTNLGRALMLMDRNLEAREILQEALSVKRMTLDEDDPALAVTERNLGNVELELSEPERAIDHFQRAEALYLAAGHAELDIARARLGRARAQAALGAKDIAGELARGALAGLTAHGASEEELQQARALADARPPD